MYCIRPRITNTMAMYNWKQIILYLKQLVEILQDLRNLQQQILVSKDEKLLTKQDVMALLGISDTTYRRYVKMARLKPMRLHGLERYRKDDMWTELAET